MREREKERKRERIKKCSLEKGDTKNVGRENALSGSVRKKTRFVQMHYRRYTANGTKQKTKQKKKLGTHTQLEKISGISYLTNPCIAKSSTSCNWSFLFAN